MTATRLKRPVRMLIVEDDAARVDAFRAWFPEPGFRILHARHGNTALSCIRTDRFDMILLDHDLLFEHPIGEQNYIDGRAVATAVALAPQHRRTPIVVHSMNPGGRNQMYRTLSANGRDVTIKPFNEWSDHYAADWREDLLESVTLSL